MLKDLRYAIRVFLRTPAFTIAAIVTLALGMGATTAVYSVYDAVLLKPLPFDEPHRVVTVEFRGPDGLPYGVSGGALAALRELPAVERAAVAAGSQTTFVDLPDPEFVRGAAVSEEFFSVFAVTPLAGATFAVTAPADALPVVLSERMWRRYFAGDASVIGRTVRLDRTVHTIVGVMPRSFAIPDDAEYWIPYRVPADELARVGTGPFRGFARLSADIATATAQAAVLGVSVGTSVRQPAYVLRPVLETTAGFYRSALTLLLGAVATVLLIACANVANLLLARTSVRASELAIRNALGATRSRLIRQLLTESCVLAAGAGALGVFIAWLLIRLLAPLAPDGIPRIDQTTIDLRVLAFTIAAAAGSVAIFGFAPVWISLRRTPSLTAGRSMTERGLRNTSRVLIAGEIAITLTLLVGSVLTLTSLHRLFSVEPGFEPRNLTVASIPMARSSPMASRPARYHERILARVRETPGIESAAALSHVPLDRRLAPRAAFAIRFADGTERRGNGRIRFASADALRTLGVPISAGRELTTADHEGAAPVAVVNEALAHLLWPGRSPLDQRLSIDSYGRKYDCQVIGVAGNMRGTLSRSADPEAYLSHLQHPSSEMTVVARSSLPTPDVLAAIRAAARADDAAQAVARASTVVELMGIATAYQRFHTTLLTVFGVFAVLLAVSGILGVVTYSVARRGREFGVRIALGASPLRIIRLVLGDVTPAIAVGLGIGLLAVSRLSFLLARQALLFEIRPSDPSIYAGAAVVIAALSIAAAWLPARRASRQIPLASMMSE